MTQENGPLNLELAEQVGKHNPCFVVHKVSGALLREALRLAMTITRVDQNAAACRFRYSLWKILPHGNGAEALVKHDNGGVFAGRRIQEHFQPLAVHREELAFLGRSGQTEPPQKHLENRFSRTQIWSMLFRD